MPKTTSVWGEISTTVCGCKGKRMKVITLQNIDEARAFAFFLVKERKRHLEDVARIDQDLKVLREAWGIAEIPDPPAGLWIELSKPSPITLEKAPEEPFYFGDATITGRE